MGRVSSMRRGGGLKGLFVPSKQTESKLSGWDVSGMLSRWHLRVLENILQKWLGSFRVSNDTLSHKYLSTWM